MKCDGLKLAESFFHACLFFSFFWPASLELELQFCLSLRIGRVVTITKILMLAF